MLIDKGYYDYDFEHPKGKKRKMTKEEREVWSDEKLRSILGRAMTADGKRVFEEKPLTVDEMQRIAMEEAKDKKYRPRG